jgi:sugar phosphate isomerase/epimerase
MHAFVNPACYRWGTPLAEFVQVSRAAGFRAVEVSIQQATTLATDLGGLTALSTWIEDTDLPIEQARDIALERLDVCHLYAAGTTMSEQPGLHGRIVFVQACDIPTGVSAQAMSGSLRVLPGAGAIDYRQFAADLTAAVHDGPLSIELFSPDRWALEPATAATALFASTVALLPTVSGEPVGGGSR